MVTVNIEEFDNVKSEDWAGKKNMKIQIFKLLWFHDVSFFNMVIPLIVCSYIRCAANRLANKCLSFMNFKVLVNR